MKVYWIALYKKIDNQETIIFGGDYNIIPNRGDAVNIEKWKNEFEDHYKKFKNSTEIIVCPNFIDLSECSKKFMYVLFFLRKNNFAIL